MWWAGAAWVARRKSPWWHWTAPKASLGSSKRPAQSDHVSEAGSLWWCVVPGAGCTDPGAQKNDSNRGNRIGRFAWGCLGSEISVASIMPFGVTLTVQLMTIQMLCTGIALATALMAADKLLVRIDLAGALPFLRSSSINCGLDRVSVHAQALFQLRHSRNDTGHFPRIKHKPSARISGRLMPKDSLTQLAVLQPNNTRKNREKSSDSIQQ